MTSRVPLPPVFCELPLAHRTLHDSAFGRVENSRSGARAAIEMGYGIEIDIQLSRDSEAMVFHDYELSRLTEQSGQVKDFLARDLTKILLTGSSDTIPTLIEFLHFIGGRVPVLIELKPQNQALETESPALSQAIARAVGDYDNVYGGALAFMSFNPHSVAHIAEALPKYPRGLVTDAFNPKEWANVAPERCHALARIGDYARLGASFVSHNVNDLDSAYLKGVRDSGGVNLCWTVRSPAQERQARKFADGITFEGYLPEFPAKAPRGKNPKGATA